MWASFGSLSVVPWILFAQMSWDMSAVPVITAAPPPAEVAAEVRDRGEVVSRAAERRAQEALRRIHRDYRIPVSIETVKSLDGAWIADVAERRARAADAEQLYILVAGSERDVGVIAARHGPASRLTDQQRETIRRAFLGPIQAGETDGALEQGVRAIGTTLADPATAEPKSEVWGLLIAMTLLLGFWAVVYAARIGASSMDWGRWRRGKAARAAGEPPTPHLTPVASVVQAAEPSVASCVTSR
jgi:uncharacterized membrane protein YgcG